LRLIGKRLSLVGRLCRLVSRKRGRILEYALWRALVIEALRLVRWSTSVDISVATEFLLELLTWCKINAGSSEIVTTTGSRRPRV